MHEIDSTPELLKYLNAEGIEFQDKDATDGVVQIFGTSAQLFEIARGFQRYIDGKKANIQIS